MEAGTKEAFIERQTPKNFTVDTLLEIKPKGEYLHVKVPIFKAEENIIISRRELRNMLKEAAQRGYEIGKEERA